MEGVSEQLKNLVKALREDAKDNLKELGIRYFYGNLAELTELTEASAPPLEMLVKLTKDFAERFQAKKREKMFWIFGYGTFCPGYPSEKGRRNLCAQPGGKRAF